MSTETFFSRWSKKKAEAKEANQGKPVEAVKFATPANDAAAPNLPADKVTLSDVEKGSSQNQEISNGAHLEAKMPETPHGSRTLPIENSPSGGDDKQLPLPSIESLTGDSDYTPFMAREVSAETRNQAMKKLFTDPRYNIMDGLDTYIDDYGKPDPIPESWLRNMYQSKALGLFDDEDKEKAAADAIANDMMANDTVASSASAEMPVTLPDNNIADDAQPTESTPTSATLDITPISVTPRLPLS